MSRRTIRPPRKRVAESSTAPGRGGPAARQPDPRGHSVRSAGQASARSQNSGTLEVREVLVAVERDQSVAAGFTRRAAERSDPAAARSHVRHAAQLHLEVAQAVGRIDDSRSCGSPSSTVLQGDVGGRQRIAKPTVWRTAALRRAAPLAESRRRRAPAPDRSQPRSRPSDSRRSMRCSGSPATRHSPSSTRARPG